MRGGLINLVTDEIVSKMTPENVVEEMFCDQLL